MRVLVIDDSAEFRTRIEECLGRAMPDAALTLWDPAKQGRPGAGFDWTRYDCLLLDDAPGPGADGLAWLSDFRSEGALPPTLVLSETGSEDIAARAIKSGASDYIRKTDITPIKLAMAIKEAVLEANGAKHEAPAPGLTQPLHIEQIGLPAGNVGVEVPGYRVLRLIGEGGMSKVYLAERQSDGYQLVLKILDSRLQHDITFRARFLREYRIIQRIQDEHVAVIFDQGFAGHHPYIAMEYFPGGDLQHRIRQGVSSVAALKILMQMAKAMHAVHAAGVVHRDLKPQNIMFREGNRLAILDFGLAREIDATTTLTQRGMVMATPLYMSPEQCLGRPHDPRGDLYATGVILYEMLTGQQPFQGDNASALAYQHVHGPIPRLPAKLAGYQPIVDKLMAKRPEDRFQSARELFAYVAH